MLFSDLIDANPFKQYISVVYSTIVYNILNNKYPFK